ncbi:MAG TPA: hypothetical protein VH639_14560 [Bryobacteraceae bacterium]|jgi:hypothetical protein
MASACSLEAVLCDSSRPVYCYCDWGSLNAKPFHRESTGIQEHAWFIAGNLPVSRGRYQIATVVGCSPAYDCNAAAAFTLQVLNRIAERKRWRGTLRG